MKPSKNHQGYLMTTIMIDKKRYTIPIHLAVAKTFLGDKSKDGYVVNHKDGNKTNNCVANLEWITQKENTLHSIYVLGNGLGTNNANAKSICGYDKRTGELKHSYDCIADCARAICGSQNYRIVQNSIVRVLSGVRKSYKGCIWKYTYADMTEL